MDGFFALISKWLAPASVGVAMFFIHRFVKRHDDFKADIYKKIDDHSRKVSDVAKEMSLTAKEIRLEAYTLRNANLDFQGKVSV